MRERIKRFYLNWIGGRTYFIRNEVLFYIIFKTKYGLLFNISSLNIKYKFTFTNALVLVYSLYGPKCSFYEEAYAFLRDECIH